MDTSASSSLSPVPTAIRFGAERSSGTYTYPVWPSYLVEIVSCGKGAKQSFVLDIATTRDHRVYEKEHRKVEKYQEMNRTNIKLWRWNPLRTRVSETHTETTSWGTARIPAKVLSKKRKKELKGLLTTCYCSLVGNIVGKKIYLSL